MGEEAAWQFMEKLDRNVSTYTHSGSAPCVQAGRGERLIGLSFDMRAATVPTCDGTKVQHLLGQAVPSERLLQALSGAEKVRLVEQNGLMTADIDRSRLTVHLGPGRLIVGIECI